MHTPNLNPVDLFTTGFEKLKINPGLIIGMWFVYSIFQGNSSSGGSGAGGQDVEPEIQLALGIFQIYPWVFIVSYGMAKTKMEDP